MSAAAPAAANRDRATRRPETLHGEAPLRGRCVVFETRRERAVRVEAGIPARGVVGASAVPCGAEFERASAMTGSTRHTGFRSSFTSVAMICSLAWGSSALLTASRAEDATSETDRLLDALDRAARRPPVAYTAVRTLRAELIEQQEQAWMDVRTEFDPVRGLRYIVLAQGGSDRIRHHALESVLRREVEASRTDGAGRMTFSTDNYRYDLDTQRSPVSIALTPLRRDERLISGTATLDQATGALLRVEGTLAKSPSFWVRDVRIQRRYATFAEATLPVEVESTAKVRMFGTARMHMTIRYESIAGRPVEATALQITQSTAPGAALAGVALPAARHSVAAGRASGQTAARAARASVLVH